MKKRKTIWVDTTLLKKAQTCGMAEFTKTYIDILKKENDVKSFYNYFSKLPIWSYKLYFIWLNTYFYIKTLLLKPDIIIFPCYYMSYFTRKKTKYYVVFYDIMLYREEFFGKKSKQSFLSRLNIAKKNASKIITISNTTKNKLVEELNIPKEQIEITYCTINNSLKQEIPYDNNILEKLDITSQKYIFSLAGSFKHKNIASLIESFDAVNKEHKDIKLVITGYKGSLELNTDNISNKNIVFAGFLPTNDIIQLYKNALLFVSPSLEEGFCMPIIEAQYFNTPVLCSDISIFKEVAENSAEFCTPTPEGIAKKINYLINAPLRRKELIKLGQQNIKRFSIDVVTKQINSIFH